jgi:ATP-binding cassette subfamily B protein
MATTNSRDWIFTHAFSESSFKSYEKNGLARRDTFKLLCRFYDPDSGAISLDGIPLCELSTTDLRRSMSVFFQQPVRYNDTVAANIRFGDLRLTDAEFSRALDKGAGDSGLDEIIAAYPTPMTRNSAVTS